MVCSKMILLFYLPALLLPVSARKDLFFDNKNINFAAKYSTEKLPEVDLSDFRQAASQWFQDPALGTRLLALLCHEFPKSEKSKLQKFITYLPKFLGVVDRIPPVDHKNVLESEQFSVGPPKDYLLQCYQSKYRPEGVVDWSSAHYDQDVVGKYPEFDQYSDWYSSFIPEVKNTRFRTLSDQLIQDVLTIGKVKKAINKNDIETNSYQQQRYLFLLHTTWRHFFQTPLPENPFPMIEFELDHYYRRKAEDDKNIRQELRLALAFYLLEHRGFRQMCENSAEKLTDAIESFNSLEVIHTKPESFVKLVKDKHRCESDRKYVIKAASGPADLKSDHYRKYLEDMGVPADFKEYIFLGLTGGEVDKHAYTIVFYHTVFKVFQHRSKFNRHDDWQFVQKTSGMSNVWAKNKRSITAVIVLFFAYLIGAVAWLGLENFSKVFSAPLSWFSSSKSSSQDWNRNNRSHLDPMYRRELSNQDSSEGSSSMMLLLIIATIVISIFGYSYYQQKNRQPDDKPEKRLSRTPTDREKNQTGSETTIEGTAGTDNETQQLMSQKSKVINRKTEVSIPETPLSIAEMKTNLDKENTKTANELLMNHKSKVISRRTEVSIPEMPSAITEMKTKLGRKNTNTIKEQMNQ